jgi:hypothetical protein
MWLHRNASYLYTTAGRIAQCLVRLTGLLRIVPVPKLVEHKTDARDTAFSLTAYLR